MGSHSLPPVSAPFAPLPADFQISTDFSNVDLDQTPTALNPCSSLFPVAPSINFIGPTPTSAHPSTTFPSSAMPPPPQVNRRSSNLSHSRRSSASSTSVHSTPALEAPMLDAVVVQPSIVFDALAMSSYQKAVLANPWAAFRSGYYPSMMPGYPQMLAEGYPPAAMFMGVEGMNLETYNMLQTQHLQQVEQYWTMYPQGQATRGPTPVPTPTPPSRPHSTEHDGPSRPASSSSVQSASSGRVQRVSFDAPLLTASPGAISLSSPFTHLSHPIVSPPFQAEPTRRETLQLNYNTVEMLQDILDGLDEPGSTLDPPSSFPSPRRALSIPSEACDSDMDGGYASSTISTASSVGDGGPGSKYANWRKPSRKRRSGANGFRVDEEPPQVSVRTQSWTSDGLGLGAEGGTPTNLGGAVEEGFNWSAFLAQPASESPVVEDTVGPHNETLQADLPSPIDSSRASKRRKSVSDAAPFPPPLPSPGPLMTSLDAGPSSQVPGAHPWLPLARSISYSTLPFTPGDDPPARSGPFSMALPKPPKLNSRSSFASSSAAGSLLSISPSKSLTSYELSSVPAPPFAPLPSGSSHRASPPVTPPIRPPAQTRSAPGSIADVQMAEASSSTGASSRRRSLKIPGASTGFASPGQGLNPVVETNQEWVPSKPRIRKSVRRRLEKRRQEEGARTEHVLASSRPPPVVPLLEPPRKTGRARRSKSKASSSGMEDGSEGSVGTEVGGRGKWRGKVQTGTEGETDESDEEEEDKPFEHGPTELPPRPWAGKSPLELARKRKIPGSAMDKIPLIEARFDALERAVEDYMKTVYLRTLQNSLLPGLDYPVDEMQALWIAHGGEGQFSGPSMSSAATPSPSDGSTSDTKMTGNELSAAV